MVLGLAGASISLWRVVTLALDHSTAAADARTLASLICFYSLLLFACALVIVGKTCFRFMYGDSFLLFQTNNGMTLLEDIAGHLGQVERHPNCKNGATGLHRVMLKWHFEHAHDITIVFGVWQGLLYASPLAFLLREYSVLT